MSIEVTRVRHEWPERAGFTINRPKGDGTYTFLYFHNAVELLVDGKVITTAPGSCIIYDIHTPQWFQSPEPLKHDWMHLIGNVPAALKAVGLQTDQVYVPQNGRFITELTRALEVEHFSKPANHTLMEELLFRELLVKLSRACNQNMPSKRLKPAMEKQLLQIRNLVFSQLGQQWSVEKMAKLCYLSPSRFHTVYRTLFGISPTEDLIHARIENAKNRLRGNQETVHAIAESLGYRNVTHFCRQFKTLTGMTPKEYRSN